MGVPDGHSPAYAEADLQIVPWTADRHQLEL